MRLMAVLVALIRLWFMCSWWIDWKRRRTKPCRAHAVKHKHMNSTKTNLPHLIASAVCREITFIWAFLLVTPSHIFHFNFLYFFTISKPLLFASFWDHSMMPVLLSSSLSFCFDQKCPIQTGLPRRFSSTQRKQSIENGIEVTDKAGRCMAMKSMN